MDAVFVGNDQMAVGVLRAAFELGLDIPNDLAVVGYDGLPESGYYTPPLSTLDQDHYKLGSLVVQEMVKILEEAPEHLYQKEKPRSLLIEPQLIVRESSLVSKYR
jgi:DNA-binding LacI/PurR family transcriptional regulator